MSRRRKYLLGFAAALASVVLAAVLAVPRLVDADAFRPSFEERLSAILGRPVILGKLRVSFWPGLGVSADGLRVEAPDRLDPARAVTLAAERVRVRASALPLLRRRLVVRSFHLDDGAIRLGGRLLGDRLSLVGRLEATPGNELGCSGTLAVRIAGLPGAPEADLEYATGLDGDLLVLHRLIGRIGDSTFEASGDLRGIRSDSPQLRLDGTASTGRTRLEGRAEITVRGGAPAIAFDVRSPFFDLDEILSAVGGTNRSGARGSWLQGLLVSPALAADPGPSGLAWLVDAVGSGSLRASSGKLAGLEISDLVARVELRRGTLQVEEASFDVAGGAHRGAFSLDIGDADLPFSISSRLGAVRVERLGAAIAPGHADVLQGSGSIEATLRGRAPGGRADRGSVGGTVRLEVRDGRIASVGVLRQVAVVLEKAGGKGIGREDTPFRSMTATFRIAGGVSRTEDLAVRSDDLDLDGKGTVGLDGRLDLEILVSFSRAVSTAMTDRNSKLRYRVGQDGRLSVPLRMAGSLVEPEVRVDLDRVLSEGVGRILEEKAKKGFLKKLLGGR